MGGSAECDDSQVLLQLPAASSVNASTQYDRANAESSSARKLVSVSVLIHDSVSSLALRANMRTRSDIIAVILAFAGGTFLGSYQVPLKAPSVLSAKVHPIIFQSYKSFWAFITGWLFVIAHLVQGKEHVFQFSWWGVLNAAVWVPSGTIVVAAIPHLGVGITTSVLLGSATLISFFVSWLILAEKMEKHGAFYLAPLYVIGIVIGVGVLLRVASSESRGQLEDKAKSGLTTMSSEYCLYLTGVICAGILEVMKLNMINMARRYSENSAHCHIPTSCPPVLNEQFNSSGSWMASFGIGALLATTIMLGAYCLYQRALGMPSPSFHWKVSRLPGSIAGLLWSVANALQITAVAIGGGAITIPAYAAGSIIASGLWGMLYYKEVQGFYRSLAFVLAMIWTAGMVALLSGEKSRS